MRLDLSIQTLFTWRARQGPHTVEIPWPVTVEDAHWVYLICRMMLQQSSVVVTWDGRIGFAGMSAGAHARKDRSGLLLLSHDAPHGLIQGDSLVSILSHLELHPQLAVPLLQVLQHGTS